MAYYRGPIVKRYTQQLKEEKQALPSRPLSPLPELRELVPPRSSASRVSKRVVYFPEEAASSLSGLPEQAWSEERRSSAHLSREAQRRTPPVRHTRETRSGGTPGRSRELPFSGTQALPTARQRTTGSGLGERAPRLRQLKKRRKQVRRTRLLVLLLLLIVVILGGLLTAALYLAEAHIFGPLSHFFHPIEGEASGALNEQPWNLLLLGSDNDRKFTFPGVLTQVMMVVRVNPLDNSATMVSLPRDSWVEVPDQGMHKIDQAFLLGASAHHNFDAGVLLARSTVEQNYGIPIYRYAWVGLDGFAKMIDTLGGVDIDVTHPIADDSYPDDTSDGKNKAHPYAVKRVYIEPGARHMSGTQALEYVRSRHADLVGDIGRTQRQQEVLQALKKKLDLSTIFQHLTELFHDLNGKVYTDLSQNEMLSLANFVRELPAGSLQRFTLGPGRGESNYGTLSRAEDDSTDQSQDVLLPNCKTIQPLINRVFDLGNAQSCQIQAG